MAATKPKQPKATAAAPAVPDPMPGWVDELGAIEKELAPYRGKIARAEMLRKAIRERVPAKPEGATFEFTGQHFIAQLGARGNQTAVNWRELVKRIGAEKFATFATASLEKLKEHVAAGHLTFCLSTEQSGPRSLKVLERGRTQ